MKLAKKTESLLQLCIKILQKTKRGIVRVIDAMQAVLGKSAYKLRMIGIEETNRKAAIMVEKMLKELEAAND